MRLIALLDALIPARLFRLQGAALLEDCVFRKEWQTAAVGRFSHSGGLPSKILEIIKSYLNMYLKITKVKYTISLL